MCEGRRGGGDGVEWTGATAALDHVLGTKILNRKTKGVKFNRDEIIDSELTNRQKILNYIRNN
jgi:ethanolamine utilization protein EutP (predicted NTPase)